MQPSFISFFLVNSRSVYNCYIKILEKKKKAKWPIHQTKWLIRIKKKVLWGVRSYSEVNISLYQQTLIDCIWYVQKSTKQFTWNYSVIFTKALWNNFNYSYFTDKENEAWMVKLLT